MASVYRLNQRAIHLLSREQQARALSLANLHIPAEVWRAQLPNDNNTVPNYAEHRESLIGPLVFLQRFQPMLHMSHDPMAARNGLVTIEMSIRYHSIGDATLIRADLEASLFAQGYERDRFRELHTEGISWRMFVKRVPDVDPAQVPAMWKMLNELCIRLTARSAPLVELRAKPYVVLLYDGSYAVRIPSGTKLTRVMLRSVGQATLALKTASPRKRPRTPMPAASANRRRVLAR